jgi:hypothetical protein
MCVAKTRQKHITAETMSYFRKLPSSQTLSLPSDSVPLVFDDLEEGQTHRRTHQRLYKVAFSGVLALCALGMFGGLLLHWKFHWTSPWK